MGIFYHRDCDDKPVLLQYRNKVYVCGTAGKLTDLGDKEGI